MKGTEPKFYLLKGRKIVRAKDVFEWGEFFGKSHRRIGYDKIGSMWVSTVFIGLNLSPWQKGPPQLFETMVFGKKFGRDLYQDRCATYDEAEAMHRRAVAMVKSGEIKEGEK